MIEAYDNDYALMHRFVEQGDANAFSILATRYADMVFATCQRILGNESQAADAAQETFFHLLKNADRVSGSLGSWLHQVATRRAVDLIRQNASRRRREEAYAKDAATKSNTWSEVEPLIDEALVNLPPESRDLLVTHFLQRKSMTQIAAAKGVSQPTVSRRVAEALEQLREALRGQGVAVGTVPLQALLLHSAEFAPESLLVGLGKLTMTHAAASQEAASGSATSSALGAKAVVGGVAASLALVAMLVLLRLPEGQSTPVSLNSPAQPQPQARAPVPTLAVTASASLPIAFPSSPASGLPGGSTSHPVASSSPIVAGLPPAAATNKIPAAQTMAAPPPVMGVPLNQLHFVRPPAPVFPTPYHRVAPTPVPQNNQTRLRTVGLGAAPPSSLVRQRAVLVPGVIRRGGNSQSAERFRRAPEWNRSSR